MSITVLFGLDNVDIFDAVAKAQDVDVAGMVVSYGNVQGETIEIYGEQTVLKFARLAEFNGTALTVYTDGTKEFIDVAKFIPVCEPVAADKIGELVFDQTELPFAVALVRGVHRLVHVI